MADQFPNDEHRYFEKFKKMWSYIDTIELIMSTANGIREDWIGSRSKNSFKGHIWKASYHQYRAMANCVQRLRAESHIR